MLGVFKIDKISSLQSYHSDPVELRFMAGIIIFFYTGIDTPSAADATGKFKTITPQSVRESFLCANLKFLSVFPRVPFFQLCNHLLLFFRGHFTKMLLQKILGLFLRARGEDRKRNASQGGQG
jgi:hypothetical protein